MYKLLHPVRFGILTVVLVTSSLSGGFVFAAVTQTDDLDYATQGEYSGAIATADGEVGFGLQVVATGDAGFRAVGFSGG